MKKVQFLGLDRSGEERVLEQARYFEIINLNLSIEINFEKICI